MKTKSRNKLENQPLTLLSIHRQTIEDATAICCDNCGKGIINFAKVTNGETIFHIGLDCKKTLIDKKQMELLEDYEVREYKKELNEVNKFLLESSRPNTVVKVDKYNHIYITDTEKINQFGMKGETVYVQNLGFLQKHGLTEYINKIKQQL